MANSDVFILYGKNNEDIFYIANTNPILWTGNILEAKKYESRYRAEYDAIKDREMFHNIQNQINNKYLSEFYVASIHDNKISWRYKLL